MSVVLVPVAGALLKKVVLENTCKHTKPGSVAYVMLN